MSVIRFENVTKSFDDQVVLRDFNMVVRQAETKVVLGGSGSGKSTILRLALGLTKPDSGRVLIDGTDITDLTEHELAPIRRGIGMVFQEGALFDSLSVGENVCYRLREDGSYSESEIESVVRRVLGFVGLQHTVGMSPAALSGGMRRRVAIARALAGGPRIVLYDEPTAGLDPITARTITELIIKLRDLEGVTSILVTHDLDTVRILANEYAEIGTDGRAVFHEENGQLCLVNTRLLMLKDGSALFEGPDELLQDFDNQYVTEFLE